MVGAGTDDAEADTPHRDAHDEIPVAALGEPTPAGQVDRRDDRDEQRQAIEMQDERADWTAPLCGDGMKAITPRFCPCGRSRAALAAPRDA